MEEQNSVLKGRKMSDEFQEACFNEFELIIYTTNSKMLEKQSRCEGEVSEKERLPKKEDL